MKTHTKALLTALAACTLVVGAADAGNILWVDSTTTSGAAGQAPEASWITLLTSGTGHTVTAFDTGQANFNLNSQSDKDYVNSFDLIIVDNSNEIFNTVRAHGANWNALETPLINLNPYLTAGSFGAGSWNWGNDGGSQPGGVSNSPNVDSPSDPVWSGVTLSGSTAPDLYDAGSRYYQEDNLKAGVTKVATDPGNSNNIIIAYAPEGSLQAGGAEQYFFASNGGNEPFTAAGEQVFLNAVNTLVPEPGSLALLGLGGVLVAARRRRG